MDLWIDVSLHMFRETFQALPQSHAKESQATILNPFAHLCWLIVQITAIEIKGNRVFYHDMQISCPDSSSPTIRLSDS